MKKNWTPARFKRTIGTVWKKFSSPPNHSRGRRKKIAAKAGTVALGAFVLTYLSLVLVLGNMQPVMFVPTTSMQPAIPRGSLILVESVPASSLKVGEIAVFNVPRVYQVQYDYPPTIAHRIISIQTTNGIMTTIQTKGDNTAEDPFQISPSQIRGEVVSVVPYLGFPLMYLDSYYGIASLIIVFAYFWIPSYAESYEKKRKETKNQQDERLRNIEVAVESFSKAMSEYAVHLQSHTAAVKELRDAAISLSEIVEKQNRVLQRAEKAAPSDAEVTIGNP